MEKASMDVSTAVSLVVNLYQALSDDEKKVVLDKMMMDRIADMVGAMPPPVIHPMGAPTPAATVQKVVYPRGGGIVRAEFARYSPVSWCRYIEGVDTSKAGAFALEGKWGKPSDRVDEGQPVFFGFKKPHGGYALLRVVSGSSQSLTSSVTGVNVVLDNVELVKWSENVQDILEEVKKLYL